MTVMLALNGLTLMLIMLAGMIGLMVLLQRPMRKQQEQQRQMRNTLQPGTRVMLTSGLFGTVLHIGKEQAIVELAPGLEVTVVKGAIAKTVTPDEEEFEFTDDLDEDDAHVQSDDQTVPGTPVEQTPADAAPADAPVGDASEERDGKPYSA